MRGAECPRAGHTGLGDPGRSLAPHASGNLKTEDQWKYAHEWHPSKTSSCSVTSIRNDSPPSPKPMISFPEFQHSNETHAWQQNIIMNKIPFLDITTLYIPNKYWVFSHSKGMTELICLNESAGPDSSDHYFKPQVSIKYQ